MLTTLKQWWETLAFRLMWPEHFQLPATPAMTVIEPRLNMSRAPAADPELWKRCQVIAWPRKLPSPGAPFPRETCAPWRRPASWLYYTLLDDPVLKAIFFGETRS